jgi:hypothetical protein
MRYMWSFRWKPFVGAYFRIVWTRNKVEFRCPLLTIGLRKDWESGVSRSVVFFGAIAEAKASNLSSGPIYFRYFREVRLPA